MNWGIRTGLLVLFGGAAVACASPTPTVELPTIRVAYSNAVDMADIPSIMANGELAKQGYTVQPTHYAEVELAVEALAQGDADFATGSTRAYWAAIGKGAPIVTIMTHARNEWAVVGLPEIQSCADLDGKRIAVNSASSISTVMLNVYIQKECPQIKPEFLTIAGSENRAAALLAGEVEAAPLEVADVVQLDLNAPGRFDTLVNFGEQLPQLETTLVYTHRDFAAQHPGAVKDYIKSVLQTYRKITEDRELLTAEVVKQLDIDADLLPKILEAEFAIKLWDVNGQLTRDSVAYTLDFFTEAGSLNPGLTPEGVADLSYLDAVLAEIGRK